ncbi:MAG: hypothetical protein PHQ28_14730, partial [Mycobacterium sp.]|nr:hypothetical protein [Mycobacterium sp.]
LRIRRRAGALPLIAAEKRGHFNLQRQPASTTQHQAGHRRQNPGQFTNRHEHRLEHRSFAFDNLAGCEADSMSGEIRTGFKMPPDMALR